MQEYETGAKRSERMPRYDLIPKCAIDRLAQRFTGEVVNSQPTGGALKYGEGNWERGLPTSDVINHIINHLTNYQETFRQALSQNINEYNYSGQQLMDAVTSDMRDHSQHIDDDLAAAMWGICVLMWQEKTRMFHDDMYPLADEKPLALVPSLGPERSDEY